MSKPAHVITPVFRVSYPNVFTAKKNELNGKDEFSVVALFKKGENMSALEKEVQRAAKKKWGEDCKITKTPQGTYQLSQPGKPSFALRVPFRDQGERESEHGMPSGYEKGAVFMNLKTSQKPGLVNQRNEDIIEASDFYAGCYAKAAVNAFAYDHKGNRGVSFGLQAIQKVKEGEPLGGRVKAQDCFSPVEDIEAGEDASSLFA